MTPLRRNRLIVVLFILVGATITLTSTLFALQDNLEFFYLPNQITNGEAPVGEQIRAGGMVVPDSIEHAEDSLRVSFALSDLEGSEYKVEYEGILPGLFKEGQGTVVTGRLDESGVFHAKTVLAKHDEQYIPPEIEALHAEP